MGTYLHPSNMGFRMSLNNEIYIDKTKLIAFTNKKINTDQRYLCVSRPRRFGKTMAANFLVAYYDCSENTEVLFHGLSISNDASFPVHLNQYDVIKVDMQSFLNKGKTAEGLLIRLQKYLGKELKQAYPHVDFTEEDDLSEVCNNIFSETGRQFVIIIDEWDCVMRRIPAWEEQKLYLDFLRDWLKDQPYVALAYMTGILPIKKYGEHSALNMFYEYSMIDSAEISDCFGFTEEEVHKLCDDYHMDFEEAKEWYDGYHLISKYHGKKVEYSMYSPKSIVECMMRESYDTYWNQTETYEALKEYILMNKDGLRDAIVAMLSGQAVRINTRHFQNDMNTFHAKDDILTLMVHLGYLTYHKEEETVSIPNKEVAKEFVSSIEMVPSYQTVNQAISDSRHLLQSLWDMDGNAVAEGVEKAHQEFSILKYNDENALSCTIQLAFYYAREYYQIIRELPAGKGYADICMIPRPRYTDIPAIVIELKWDKNVRTAIDQIYKKKYPDALKDYKDNLLLCGINYEKEDKKHACVIERFV